MESSEVSVAEVRLGRKFRTATDKFREYEAARRDRETPFNGHQCRALRQQMGYTVKRFSRLVGCSHAYMSDRESNGGNFGVAFRARLNEIKRLADKAQADLRDRYEMPDFHK